MDGYTSPFYLATELFVSKVSLQATMSHEQTSPLFGSIRFGEFNVPPHKATMKFPSYVEEETWNFVVATK